MLPLNTQSPPEAGPSKRKKSTGRTNVTKACENCKRRKHKCDGQKPSCGTCVAFSDDCRWGPTPDGRSAPTQELVLALKNRVKELEKLLGTKGSFSEAESDSEEDEVESVSQTMLHLQMGDDGEEVHYHGPTSAYAHQSSKIPQKKSPVPLLDLSLEVHNWRRYLPLSVQLTEEQHRTCLDRFFRFFSSWGMRATPNLFQKDLMQAINSSSSSLPRTTHYSPLLHNIILSIALIFADEDHLRLPSTRAVFAAEAQSHLDNELKRPTIATAIGLALKSSYHSTMGDHTTGWTYYALADRAAQSLGLNVDCTSLVKSNGMTDTEMQQRNNAFWTVFIQDQCWSVYIGRPHSVQDYNTPLPKVDPTMDKIQWTWPDTQPQDSYLSSTFVETAKLSVIMQNIMTTLYSLNSDVNKLLKDGSISKLNVELATWHSGLPTALGVANRPLPHIIMLHLAYEWLVILLHRPYYRPVVGLSGIREGAEKQAESAMKRCDRSAAQINNLLRMYHDRFHLRFTPPTLLNVAFTAGTTHLLTAVHHADAKRKSEALQRAEECVKLLRLVAISWPAAADKADILETLVKEWVPPEPSVEPAFDFVAASQDGFQAVPMTIPDQNAWYQPPAQSWSFSPPAQQQSNEVMEAWMRNLTTYQMPLTPLPPPAPTQITPEMADFLRSLFTHISLPPTQTLPTYPPPPSYPPLGMSPPNRQPWPFAQTPVQHTMPSLDITSTGPIYGFQSPAPQNTDELAWANFFGT